MTTERPPYRLAYFVSHPIQYQAPLLRRLAADPQVELKVFFYSDFSLRAYHDPGFGKTFQWDVPLTGGYDFEILPRWGSRPAAGAADRPFFPARSIGRTLDNGGRPFDAVWVHGWGHVCSWQAILAASSRGIPILMRGESQNLGIPSPGFRQRVKKYVLSRLFQRVAAFLAIGCLNREFYLGYGLHPEKIFHVPYTVDNDEFQQRAEAVTPERLAGLRRELGLDLARPIILFAAKLTEVKNPLALLAAYRLLSPDAGRSEPEPYLLYVGEGMLRPELERAAAATGWKSIRLLGFRNQSELPDFYRLCDVFALPSLFEPWGLVVNEAMNAGRAVVVSDRVGSGPDLVEDGLNGKVFPAGDTPALAEALRWALAHAPAAGEASRRRIATWSYREDIAGIKLALTSVCR